MVKDVKTFKTSCKDVLLIRVLSVIRNLKARGKMRHVLVLLFRAQRAVYSNDHFI